MLISCLMKGIQMSPIMTGVCSICSVLALDLMTDEDLSVMRVYLTNYTIFTMCL